MFSLFVLQAETETIGRYVGPLAVGGLTLAAVAVYLFVRLVLPMLMGGQR